MLERRIASDGPVYYVSPLLERTGVPHAFSTRCGGKSSTPFDSLNLGNPSGCAVQDDSERIEQNYQRLQRAIACHGCRRCSVHQVHGGKVIAISESFESGIKADAMVTADAGKVLSVRIADCVPVLLATEDGRAVAAIHAGWRGIIAGVVPNSLDALRSMDVSPMHPGASAKAPCQQVIAAIGPCIGFDHFEVGPEVIEAFEAAFGNDAPVRRRDHGKGHVDLRAAVALQLRAAGIPESCIDVTDRCTFRDADEFFSHRRDHGLTGRMAALISPRAHA